MERLLGRVLAVKNGSKNYGVIIKLLNFTGRFLSLFSEPRSVSNRPRKYL